MFALLIPISLTVFAKNTNAREDAKIERNKKEDKVLKVKLTAVRSFLSKIMNRGRNIKAPIMFCQATRVTGEYFRVSFLRKTEKTKAEITAPKSASTPLPSPENERSLVTSMIVTPEKDINIPKILSFEILSLNVSQPSTGVNTGIVAMITLEIVADVNLTPKFSPKKYRKGLNNALPIRSQRSCFFMVSNLPDNIISKNRKADEINRRMKIMVTG